MTTPERRKTTDEAALRTSSGDEVHVKILESPDKVTLLTIQFPRDGRPLIRTVFADSQNGSSVEIEFAEFGPGWQKNVRRT